MSSERPAIMWFRRDLRLADNPALVEAAIGGRSVIPIYIHDDSSTERAVGGASRWWLDKSLKALSKDLATIGSPLVLRRGAPEDVLRGLIRETGAGAVYWNRLYDSPSIARDTRIKCDLVARGVQCRSFKAALLNEPWTVTTTGGGPYRVFTPYWRATRATTRLTLPLPAPSALTPPAMPLKGEALVSWRLHPSRPDWSAGFDGWTPGEAGARERLDTFLSGSASHQYCQGRNQPGREGTSRLSPHIHFGEIGPRQIWASVLRAQETGNAPDADLETFLKELGWREFNIHLLFHQPAITHSTFNTLFERFPWRIDPESMDAWRRGLTGYPIVDAGMRQLWQTGWMHNRVRMIAASFLVKDLMIDWRLGESWFWDTLVDADLAINVANWQWVAGSGADAAPYFRIFNPTLQGERFDAAGAYVRRWVPELSALSDDDIHKPWMAAPARLAAAGVTLGVSYPHPIVDHSAARTRALAAYKELS